MVRLRLARLVSCSHIMLSSVFADTGRLTCKASSEPVCLAVKASGADQESGSARSEGTQIDARLCGHAESHDQYADYELADMWRLDSSGLLISHVSGLCLVPSDGDRAPLVQKKCAPDSPRWAHAETGQLQLLSRMKKCLSVHTSPDPGPSLELDDCNADSSAWEFEKASLVTYPVPELGYLAYGSPFYKVVVSQGQREFHPFVNFMDAQDRDPDDKQGLSNSFVIFSFDGTVKISVTKLNGAFNDVAVRPLSAGVQANPLNETTIEFEISEPNSKLSVEFDDEWMTNSLFIFADPLEEDIPGMFDAGVHYVNVGENNINHIDLDSNDVVYIAGGAWVFGKTDSQPLVASQYSSSLSNIKVKGRGVLSGKMTESVDGGSAIVTLCGSDVEVEGITVVSPPAQQVFQVNAPWFCDGGWDNSARGAHVHNVKLLGWNFADGIIAGSGSHVHNVFTRLNDDNVKPMMGDSVFEDNVHWQGGNGWAIMLAWCGYGAQDNITVRRSAVIHDDHQYDFPVDGCDPCTPNQAAIGAVQGGPGTITNVLLEDITLETQVWRPFWFGIDKNTWASEGTGVLAGWRVKNLQILEGSAVRGIIWGADDANQVNNIIFEDMKLWGSPVATFSDANIELHGHMHDVGFAVEAVV